MSLYDNIDKLLVENPSAEILEYNMLQLMLKHFPPLFHQSSKHKSQQNKMIILQNKFGCQSINELYNFLNCKLLYFFEKNICHNTLLIDSKNLAASGSEKLFATDENKNNTCSWWSDNYIKEMCCDYASHMIYPYINSYYNNKNIFAQKCDCVNNRIQLIFNNNIIDQLTHIAITIFPDIGRMIVIGNLGYIPYAIGITLFNDKNIVFNENIGYSMYTFVSIHHLIANLDKILNGMYSCV